jgi:hypothetical protein
VGGSGKKDTLCYATQVNQDALSRALAEPLDAAFVIGGQNSSNTYQLFRLCEQKLGSRAYFIQSEENIRSRDDVQHYVFPTAGLDHTGRMERRAFPDGGDPLRVLITGGASCPDGLIQQVIARINTFFPADDGCGAIEGADVLVPTANFQSVPGNWSPVFTKWRSHLLGAGRTMSDRLLECQPPIRGTKRTGQR